MNSGTNEEKEISVVRYKAVVVANSMAFDELYQKLETKDGEKEVFKLARARKTRTRGLGVVRCIKDENDKVLSEDAVIKERWQRYFSKFLNGEGMEDFHSTERE